MQSSVTSVTSPQAQPIYQAPAPLKQSSKLPAPAETASPSLNQPQSAYFQPATSTTPSYSPNQPSSVEQAQVNKRVDEQQKAATIKMQQVRIPVQVADKNLAASVLTGEYNSNAAQLRGTHVGSHLAVKA